jgi:hypothetical protein
VHHTSILAMSLSQWEFTRIGPLGACFKGIDNVKDPVTGQYMYTDSEGFKDDNHLDNLQSGAWCFPILSILAKDNNGTYEKYLRPIFEYCEELRTVGGPNLGWKPFIVSEPHDMQSCWICLHRVGAAKSPSVK